MNSHLNTTLHILGSSSAGNGYILTCGGEHLLLECGVSSAKYLQALQYDLSKVNGCLVSHRHGDHAEYIPAIQKLSIDVYSCQDVCEHYSHVYCLKKGKKTKIGQFVVQPIPLSHSVENYGYLIICPNGHRIVFATDCASFEARIADVNTWLIEANYDENIVMDHLLADAAIRSQYDNHLEISQTIAALVANHSAAMNNVVLLHLSNGNSNAKDFQSRVQAALSYPSVVVADNGMVVQLPKEEF